MANRNPCEDYRRHERGTEFRAERERGRGAARYAAEDPSLDDAPSSGVRRDFDRSHGGAIQSNPPATRVAGGDEAAKKKN